MNVVVHVAAPVLSSQHEGDFMWMLIIGLLIGLASPIEATAAPLRLKIFGMEVEVKDGPNHLQQLIVDGRRLHTATLLAVDEIAVVGGIGVVVGTSGTGGNLCDVAHFIVSKSSGAAARLDGPIDTCGSHVARVGPDAIEFERAARPGRPGERWRWTYANGIQSLGDVTFRPSLRGWPELRERTVNHPGQLLEFGPIADQVRSLLGRNYPEFARIIDGPGSGDFRGDVFVGRACAPHRCGDEESIIAADLRNQRVFIALKQENSAVAVYPPVAEWPPLARAALRDWARKWR